MTTLPLLDSCELEDAVPAAAPATTIDTAEKRLQSWAYTCKNGSTNVLSVDGVVYSWDAHPRLLKNGALEGRVYAQRSGEIAHNIGGFKIAGDGRVLEIPRELAGVLPGADRALEHEDHEEPRPA